MIGFSEIRKQPPEGAVLGADVLGEDRACVPEGRIVNGTSEPPLENLIGVRELEVEDQIVDA